MEDFAPDAAPGKFPIDQHLIKEVRRSMEDLERIDWKEAEEGVYPKSQLFDAPFRYRHPYPSLYVHRKRAARGGHTENHSSPSFT